MFFARPTKAVPKLLILPIISVLKIAAKVVPKPIKTTLFLSIKAGNSLKKSITFLSMLNPAVNTLVKNN